MNIYQILEDKQREHFSKKKEKFLLRVYIILSQRLLSYAFYLLTIPQDIV